MSNSAAYEIEDGVAIVGMAGRFPGAGDLGTFWRNLCAGVQSVARFSAAELEAAGVRPAILCRPDYVRAGGVLEGIELFDAEFFGIAPREAEITDPQHRLFLECAWEALENAGYDPERETAPIGVFAGAGLNHYLLHHLVGNPQLEGLDPLARQIGNAGDFLTTRLSYKLNLKGPSVAVQTACSTSLVAVQLAWQSLLNYQCDMALAGGVSLRLPQAGYLYRDSGIRSPDGRCRPFDARARGTVLGNGAGVVLLKRLAEALADGDSIRAVLRAAAINNDGSLKAGYTAPSAEGQAEVIAQAQALAGIGAETITYVEAHGTGTRLGDPVEVAALTQAFRRSTDARNFCTLGSVKGNVGHLDAAAGVAGLIKTVLALEHRQLPPNPGFAEPNPEIDFTSSPFRVNTRLEEWRAAGGRRRAGVSSFGIGGTNAHVVLEEAPAREASGPSRALQLLVLSARTDAALETTTARLAAFLHEHPEHELADVAYTLQVGRRHFDHRRIWIGRNREDAVAALGKPDRLATAVRPPGKRPVAFLFPGQGAQYVGMGLDLYRDEERFRTEVDRCAETLRPHLRVDLRRLLYPAAEDEAEARRQLARTALAQPALFTVEYALARLWMAWGVRPAAMIGHSLGEYVAACLAGVFSLQEALALVAARGRLMQEMPGGAMLAVPLAEEDLAPRLGAQLSLAAVNGPARSVVSGPAEAIAELAAELAGEGIRSRRLSTAHAFHARCAEPILEAFCREVEAVRRAEPEIAFLSNLTGTWITPREATDPQYWVRHLRQTVRFGAGLGELLREPSWVLLEVGPGHTLSNLARRHPARRSEQPVLSSLPPQRGSRSDPELLIGSLGELWSSGVEIDWRAFSAAQRRLRVPLPTYPFERRRYWIEPPGRRPETAAIAPEDGKRSDLAEWFYAPRWRESELPAAVDARALEPEERRWLVFAPAAGLLGPPLLRHLERLGWELVVVTPAERFARTGEGTYTLDPRDPRSYDALVAELESTGRMPRRMVHLWGVFAAPAEAQDLGFYSLIFLLQAFGRGGDPRGRLDVVTANMQSVTGAEALCPEKATVLGPCQVIPQEYPQVTCRSVDVVVPPPASAAAQPLIEQLAGELAAPARETRVAYRDGRRLVQEFAPLRLEEDPQWHTRLRERGVYLIVGGLGGVGLELAEVLARAVRARLVLTGRSPLPPRDAWPRWLEEDPPAFDPRAEAARLAQLEKRLETRLEVRTIGDDPELEAELERLCASYLYRYLFAAEAPDGEIRSIAELRAQLGILPAFERFFAFMLEALAADGLIRRDGDRLELVAGPGASPGALRRALEAGHPQLRGLCELLDHCARHYHEALSGGIPAISVLYPEGRSELLDRAAEQTSPAGREALYVAMVRELVGELAARSPRPLRILEVGGGRGKLTWELAAELARHEVIYHFTDVGRSFVVAAEREAARRGFAFMRCRALDISRDPQQQGFAAGEFDAVLGLNVVHATPRIAETLEGLKQLLVPGGVLGLVEAIRPQRWDTMIWGLAEGWWSFADPELRPRSCLLDLAGWRKVLEAGDFCDVLSFPPEVSPSDTGLLLARRRPRAPRPELPSRGSDETAIRETIRKIRELERHGAEVEVLSADVTRRDQMRAVKERIRERFGKVDGIIHSALVLRDGAMQRKSREVMASVLAPKLEGTRVLYEVFGEAPPDFFVLCSSLAGIQGGFGQVDYSAANAFQDAFAHCHRGGGPLMVSINWDAWLEVGAAARLALSEAGTNEASYAVRLSTARHWILSEHRVEGRAVVPGTAYLEMARAAFERQARAAALEMREVVFLHPLAVADGEEKQVRTLLRGHGAEFEFSILAAGPGADSGGPGWQEHARGMIRALPPPRPAPQAPAELERELAGATAGAPGDATLELGPRWQTVLRKKLGDREAVALLELPDTLAGDLESFRLHPALLDAATAFWLEERGRFRPFSYGSIRVYAPLPRRIFSRVRFADADRSPADTVTVDATLFDARGRPVVEIERYTLRRVAQPREAPAPAAENFTLAITSPGNLESLTLRPAARRLPGPGEVAIAVTAAGLNFKDVLTALGMLAGAPEKGELGHECVGRIAALGEGVGELHRGQEVLAVSPGAASAFAVVPASCVVAKPPALRPEEAVTLPVAYTTAYYALHHLGRLAAGERVLIHAAAGGVGLAAVHLARRAGAEIFATAGSPAKRAFLESLGIVHVFDSRSPSFAAGVMERTGGRGVDVVLSSLAGELRDQGLAILSPYGRFLELGMRDRGQEARLDLRPFARNLAFFAINLGPDYPGFGELLREVVELAATGVLPPLPHRVFPIAQSSEAFSFMARARHIGKIVLAMPGAVLPAPQRFTLPAEIRCGLSPQEGAEAFRRILGRNLTQVVVSTRDLNRRLEEKRTFSTLSATALAPAPPAPPAHPRPAMAQPYVAPGDEIERSLVGIWEELLGIREPGVRDNFFELGGDSLVATQLLSRLREAFQVELEMPEMFEKVTIARLAAEVRERRGTAAAAIQPIRGAGEEELLANLGKLSDQEVTSMLQELTGSQP